MRVLFFVEPRVDSGQPYVREWWVSPFVRDMAATLRASSGGEQFDLALAFNEALFLKRGGLDGVRSVVFSQGELFPPLMGDANDLAVSWYRGTYTRERLDYYAALMREKLGDFVPDVVISFSPAPYIEAAFPGVLVLHHEACLFNRAPFPHTWFFDPVGMYFGTPSYLQRFAPQIAATPLDAAQQALLQAFRDDCRGLLLATSPFRALMAEQRTRFRRLALLPLLGQHHWGFEGPRRMIARNEFQFICDVLERVPRDIGVVVTYPPDLVDPYTDDTLDYFRRRYPNFICDDAFTRFHAPSQFLFPEVDALIGMQSSLCWQAMLFEKVFLDVGGDLGFIADADRLDQLSEAIDAGPRRRDGFLYWVLTRYALLHEHLHDPEWFAGFLRHSWQVHRERGVDAQFFRPVDRDERIFALLRDTMDRQVPKRPPVVAYRRLMAELEQARRRLQELSQRPAAVPPVAAVPVAAQAPTAVDLSSFAMECARRLIDEGRPEDALASLRESVGHLRLALGTVEAAARSVRDTGRLPDTARARLAKSSTS